MCEFPSVLIKVSIGFAEQIFNCRAVSFGDSVVNECEPPLAVLGKDETWIEVDNLAQKHALLVELCRAFLYFCFQFIVRLAQSLLGAFPFADVPDNCAENV